MVSRDFSGDDVIKVLGNVGGFEWQRTTGDHVIMKWFPPKEHDTEPRTVSVPRHDRIDTGTLRNIADQAGAENFDAFCEWIDRNC
ncbi:type II toxin-antitoxin system HicA family toxin [Haloarcula marina]|uniref:type II toxin-antitoxin system HicA family toxin n=1 Tax=Haloarcula marina TaxID=2961574 RepID=UPI0020B6FD5D|nr:type II toxin-antitoxin system HicA family toxin [Halomicroarcula marina]